MNPASSLFREKNKSLRQSTPDSEALASSEDELDQQLHRPGISTQSTRVVRRPSWINDNQQSLQHKRSGVGSALAGSIPDSANATNNSGSWSSHPSGRGHSASASPAWPSSIWNTESHKPIPSKLSEVLSSPTSSRSWAVSDETRSVSVRRDSATHTGIPFAIPLQPTLKTYRSQSYSVGQLEPDASQPSVPKIQNGQSAVRRRTGSSYSNIANRPSRQGLFGEYSLDGGGLEQLREVDDDDEISSAGSESGLRLTNDPSRTIEQLAMENLMLRQAAFNSQLQSTHRHNGHQQSRRNLLQKFRTMDSAIDEPDLVPSYNAETVFSPGNYTASAEIVTSHGSESQVGSAVGDRLSNRTIDNLKRTHWSSSLGFGGLGEPPQSRRHSFADIPPRREVLSSGSDSKRSIANDSASSVIAHNEPQDRLQPPDSANGYGPALENIPLSSNHYRGPLGVLPPNMNFSSTSQTSRALINHSLGQGQTLYLVTFKAARAEFYYVQDGTGLEVKAGDLVIVEADRGTDLGTIAHENVDLRSAKELRDRYTEEHYRWLMMFSRQGHAGSTQNPHQMSMPGIAQGGMSLGLSYDSPTSEIKPKMIKRLAQPHEIQTLRDKEANEAKAKRTCQAKVAEHHLAMEILDAEFQMDWKKLTFYYFADSYVNFNHLVTDLFKIYKTRIWMSAVNPASFATPSAGLQMPSALGPGAVLSGETERYGNYNGRRDNRAFHPSGNISSSSGSQEPPWVHQYDHEYLSSGPSSSFQPLSYHTAGGPFGYGRANQINHGNTPATSYHMETSSEGIVYPWQAMGGLSLGP